ncbi:hypothetical protein CJU33_32920, partial [Pseudomonas aeruginosa]
RLAIRADPPYLAEQRGDAGVAVAGQVAADLDFRVQPRKDLAQLRAEAVIAHGDGEIQFIPAAGLAELDDIADEDVLPFSVEQ